MRPRLLPPATLGLCAAITVTLPVKAWVAADPATLTLPDGRNYGQGSYAAYAGPWSTLSDTGLKRGRDYFDTITVRPARFPDGTLIDTRWPTTFPKTGVWGYMAVTFGNYDGYRPPAPVPFRRVDDITRLIEEFDFDYRGSDRFNALNEFYLTARPNDAAAKVAEVGFFLHLPPSTSRFIAGGTPIATYRGAQGRVWRIVRLGTFFTIAPLDGADVRHGVIDIRQALRVLKIKGAITGREWFNGVAFGTEPTYGGDRTRLLIRRWKVDYAGVPAGTGR